MSPKTDGAVPDEVGPRQRVGGVGANAAAAHNFANTVSLIQGGSLSIETEGEVAKWLSDDTRHLLAELDPNPTK